MTHDHGCLVLAARFLETRFPTVAAELLMERAERLADSIQRHIEDELADFEDELDDDETVVVAEK